MAQEEKTVMTMMMVIMMVGIMQVLIQPVEAAEPTEPEPGAGIVSVKLKNAPTGDKWQLRIVDWDITETIFIQDIAMSGYADFVSIPADWVFPLRVDLTVYEATDGGFRQVYRVQSWRPTDPFTGSPDPDYKEVYIPSLGSFEYNVATEEFEVAS